MKDSRDHRGRVQFSADISLHVREVEIFIAYEMGLILDPRTIRSLAATRSSLMRPTIYLVGANAEQIDQFSSCATQLDYVALAYESADEFVLYFDESTPNCTVLFGELGKETIDDIAETLLRKSPTPQIMVVVHNWKIADIISLIKRGVGNVVEPKIDLESISHMLVESIAQDTMNRSVERLTVPKHLSDQLTHEESRIFNLMMSGRTTKQVGAELDLSVRTIHYRKKSIFQKLGVQNRSEAIELIRTLCRSNDSSVTYSIVPNY